MLLRRVAVGSEAHFKGIEAEPLPRDQPEPGIHEVWHLLSFAQSSAATVASSHQLLGGSVFAPAAASNLLLAIANGSAWTMDTRGMAFVCPLLTGVYHITHTVCVCALSLTGCIVGLQSAELFWNVWRGTRTLSLHDHNWCHVTNYSLGVCLCGSALRATV